MASARKIENMREHYFKYIIVSNLSIIGNVACTVSLLKVTDNNNIISAHQYSKFSHLTRS